MCQSYASFVPKNYYNVIIMTYQPWTNESYNIGLKHLWI